MRAAEFLSPTGPMAKCIDGYECRPSQMEMADAVDRNLMDNGTLLVEAGTGTGKTLAYLVPAVLSGPRGVVSTGTKTLQDQIMQTDVPLLEKAFGHELSVVCMKGLSNYVCKRRLNEFRSSAKSLASRSLPTVARWEESSRTGDRAELDELDENDSVWANVTSGPDTRIGPKCSYYDECHVTRVRRAAADAQIVVVNHHLYFADLALRGPHGGGFLPEHDCVIFDEAHQIEDTITQFFGVTLSSTKVEVFARDLEAVFDAAGDANEGRELAGKTLVDSANFFAALPRGRSDEVGRRPLLSEHFTGDLETAMFRFDATLEAIAAAGKRIGAGSEGVGQIVRRASVMRNDLAKVAEGEKGSQVAWVETRGRRVSCGASPVDVSTIMREEVFFRTDAVVLTSATLTTSGSFKYIKQRLGVDFEIDELTLESPFNYEEQAALFVAEELPDPRSKGFVPEAAKKVLELVSLTGGGAFVLCTSYRTMNGLHAACRDHIQYPVLLQGDAPKAKLLERFRRERNAVLFATASFWEGVDVPGEALRLVVIDKLPFDVPTDPLVVARCKRLEEQGESPFIRYLVPSAALSLKQGFGRLIRSGRDRGIVAIFDPRVAKKGYGKVFLRSLPAAKRCSSVDDLGRFWGGRV